MRLQVPGDPQPISVQARRIVSREVIAFRWQHTMVVPMFQFEENSLNPTPCPTRGMFAAPLNPENSVHSTEESRWKRNSDRSAQA